MKVLIKTSIGLFVIFLISCSGVKITTDQSTTADFGKYKTFQVIQLISEEELKDNSFKKTELNQKRITDAIIGEAEARGMKIANDPDAFLLWSMGIDLQKNYSTHTTYAGGSHLGYRGGRRGGYRGGGGMSSSYSTTSEYETILGNLSISLVDASTEELLWLGAGSKQLKSNNKKIEQNINKAVGKIMSKYPEEKK